MRRVRLGQYLWGAQQLPRKGASLHKYRSNRAIFALLCVFPVFPENNSQK
jgi:hypothetical protein